MTTRRQRGRIVRPSSDCSRGSLEGDSLWRIRFSYLRAAICSMLSNMRANPRFYAGFPPLSRCCPQLSLSGADYPSNLGDGGWGLFRAGLQRYVPDYLAVAPYRPSEGGLPWGE